MRVLLRDSQTGLYYKGAGAWVPERVAAVDFRTIQSAGRKAQECDQESLEVVLDYDNPKCELALNPVYCIQKTSTKATAAQQPRL